jgi:Tfp pilus assembly protein PilX
VVVLVVVVLVVVVLVVVVLVVVVLDQQMSHWYQDTFVHILHKIYC